MAMESKDKKEKVTIPKEEFKTRLKKSKSNDALWNSILEESYDLFLPNRQTQTIQSPGEERYTALYESTGVQALQEFVNNLKQGLLPSNQQWANAKPSGKVKAEVDQGKATQDEINELEKNMGQAMRTVFNYIWQSNFDQAVHESLQDAAISTGAMFLLDNDDIRNPLNFVPIPSNQLILEKDGHGGYSAVFRERCIKAREIRELFPKAKSDPGIDKLIEDSPDKEVTVVEGIIKDRKSSQKGYHYLIDIKECTDRDYFYEDKYEVSPCIIFRISVTPGEVRGRGPAINALATMRVLNKLVEQLLYNNDMAISPPAMVDTSSYLLDISNVKLQPFALLPVNRDFEGQPSAFKYLETSANFNIGQNMRADYQNQVRSMFVLPQIGDVTDATKSATEISIRNNQALSQQAAMFGRLSRELVNAIIKRAWYVLSGYGIVPKEFDIAGEAVEIVSTSPLARVQDSADLEGLMNYLNASMQLGQQGQMMFVTTVDEDKVGPYMANKMGVPPELLLSDKDRQARKQQLQQQMQAMAQAQAQQGQQGGGQNG